MTLNMNCEEDLNKLIKCKDFAYNNIDQIKKNSKGQNSSSQSPGFLQITLEGLAEYIHHITTVIQRFGSEIVDAFPAPIVAYSQFNSFSTDEIDVSKNLTYEKMVALYNFATILMLLGQKSERNTDIECKAVVSYFIKAASIFSEIAENYCSSSLGLVETFTVKNGQKVENNNGKNELNVHSMRLAMNLCLAQAQECCLEKATRENRKSLVLARLAHQIVVFYENMLEIFEEQMGKGTSSQGKLSSLLTNNSNFNEYLDYIMIFIKPKLKYYSAITHIHCAEANKQTSNYREMLKHYEDADKRGKEAYELSKHQNCQNEELCIAIELAHSIINQLKEQSIKDNNSIYFERVADSVSLPAPACLVKITPFSPEILLLEGEGKTVTYPNLFSSILPVEIQIYLTTYEDMKANFLEIVLARVQKTNDDLAIFKAKMDIDQRKKFKIPLFLTEEGLEPKEDQIYQIEDSLIALFSRIKSLGTEISEFTENFEKLQRLVDNSSDEKNQAYLPKQMKEPVIDAIKTATNDLTDSKKYLTILQKIDSIPENAEFIDKLHEKITEAENQENFSNANGTKITKQNLSSIDYINLLYKKIEEMESQRDYLINKLSTDLANDNIQRKFLANSAKFKNEDDHNEFLKAELAKHEAGQMSVNSEGDGSSPSNPTTLSYLNTNLAAQENILSTLTESNIEINEIFERLDHYFDQRAKNIVDLQEACDNFEKLSQKCGMGITFFEQVMTKINDLKAIDNKRTVPIPNATQQTQQKMPPKNSANAQNNKNFITTAKGETVDLSQLPAEMRETVRDDPEFLQFLIDNGELKPVSSSQNLIPNSQSKPQNSLQSPGFPPNRPPQIQSKPINLPSNIPINAAPIRNNYRPQVQPMQQVASRPLNAPPIRQPPNQMTNMQNNFMNMNLNNNQGYRQNLPQLPINSTVNPAMQGFNNSQYNQNDQFSSHPVQNSVPTGSNQNNNNNQILQPQKPKEPELTDTMKDLMGIF